MANQPKKKRTKRVKTGRAHDARTGQYVTKKKAQKHPGRVVEETRVVDDYKTVETEKES